MCLYPLMRHYVRNVFDWKKMLNKLCNKSAQAVLILVGSIFTMLGSQNSCQETYYCFDSGWERLSSQDTLEQRLDRRGLFVCREEAEWVQQNYKKVGTQSNAVFTRSLSSSQIVGAQRGLSIHHKMYMFSKNRWNTCIIHTVYCSTNCRFGFHPFI